MAVLVVSLQWTTEFHICAMYIVFKYVFCRTTYTSLSFHCLRTFSPLIQIDSPTSAFANIRVLCHGDHYQSPPSLLPVVIPVLMQARRLNGDGKSTKHYIGSDLRPAAHQTLPCSQIRQQSPTSCAAALLLAVRHFDVALNSSNTFIRRIGLDYMRCSM